MRISTKTPRANVFLAVCALLGMAFVSPAAAAAQADGAQPARVARVSRADLLAAMRPERDYDAATTTNSSRFQSNVYLRLARAAQADGTDVLLIGHEDWYQAFLTYSGMPEDEMPEFLLLLREHGQNAVLDFRAGAVIDHVVEGRAPELAMNVQITFEDRAGRAKSFSYEDHLSEPAVLVHNDDEISFRLLDMGDQIYLDEIHGSKVRPLTGSLGALFAVIGLAEIRSVRMAVADDGTTVSVARAQKSIVSVPGAVTTSPWGRTERGVSGSRDDLRELERRLHEPLEFDYVDVDWDAVTAMTRGVAGVRRPLDVEFIGNMALRITDGADTIYSDFPYVPGAHGYMEYPEDAVRQAVAGATLVTHAHADHWDPERFAATRLALIAPPEISAGLAADRVLPWGQSIRYGTVEVQPVVTPHTDDGPHVSYRVLWGNKRLYFTGDAETSEALLAESDLDVAFVSPWLLRSILAAGDTIDAELVVVYHHTSDEDVPRGPGIHVPTQSGTFRIR
jgi:hypothetical protein